jgi:hypothetical protein
MKRRQPREKRDASGRRLLLVLLAVFAVLLAVTVYQNRQQVSQSTLPFERVYPDLQEGDVQAIRLRNPESNETFTINRTLDGAWEAPDHQGTLDQTVAYTIAQTIVLLPYDRTLPPVADEELAEYGFTADGRLSVEILLADGGTHAVLVGSRAPSDLVYYGLVDDRAEIYLLYRGAIDFLSQQLRTPPVA